MKSLFTRKNFVLALGLVLTMLMTASDVEAGKKKKKKKKKKQTPPVTATQQADPGGLPPQSAAVREAIRHLEAYNTEAASEALTAADSDAWSGTARGRILAQSGDYEKAAGELRGAADLDTRNPAPALFLGDSYSYANKRGSANDAYAQAEARAHGLLDAQPDDPDALYFLGVAQQRLKRFDEAAANLERARSLRPDDAMILCQLGITRFYQDQFQPAFDSLEKAIAADSGIAYAYYYRGLAAGKLGRKDLLYNDMDRFVKMAPDAPEAVTAKQILSSYG